MSSVSPQTMEAEGSAALSEVARSALRDLILSLADSKRVLGLRYSDRMLGAPALEAGIAASSMAQDEWGHARLTYSLLSDFGDDPKQLETERSAAEYRSMAALDAPLGSWAAMIAAVLLVDTALSVQYRALLESRYQPAHNRVQKLLDEEAFHFQYAVGWTRQIAQAAEMRGDFVAELRRILPEALLWFGREGAEGAQALLAEGVVNESTDALRARFLGRVGPVLGAAGLAEEVGVNAAEEGWLFSESLVWPEWSDEARRPLGTLAERLMREPGVGDVRITEVWNPGWSKARVSPEGREQLKKLGVSL